MSTIKKIQQLATMRKITMENDSNFPDPHFYKKCIPQLLKSTTHYILLQLSLTDNKCKIPLIRIKFTTSHNYNNSSAYNPPPTLVKYLQPLHPK
jgi:hypothetical protein